MKLRERRNQLTVTAEGWRPPPFARPTKSLLSRAAAAARRFLDLQAASIWADLSQELPALRGTVVDVGCGAQPYRPLLDESVRYIGIDSAQAEQHFGYKIPDTIYYEGLRWPLEDAVADAVLCTETLEHIPEPAAFLAEAARCVRPGGTLIVTVPFAARWHFIPHDYWRYTPSSLANLLARDFEDVAIYARGNALTVACYKTMALILPLLAAQNRSAGAAVLSRFIGLLLSPLLVALAVVAHLSLQSAGGADCLGYTVVGKRRMKDEG